MLIVQLLRKLRRFYPQMSLKDIIIAGLEELLYQNRRSNE